jgi:hypothetical protein
MTQLFNRRALQNRHRVGERTGPITLLTPPLRLTLLLGLAIAAGGGVWATLARIPITVQGTGVLLPVSTINSSLSGVKGNAHWMFNRPTEDWHIQALRFVQSSGNVSDDQAAALSSAVLQAGASVRMHRTTDASTGSPSSAMQFAQNLRETFHGRRILGNSLLLWVQSSENHERLQGSLDNLQRALSDYKEKQENISIKQEILNRELQSRSSYLAKMRTLESKGYVSLASILQEQAQLQAIRSQILSNNTELINLRGHKNEAYKDLRNALAALIHQEMIFTEREVYLSQVIPNDGESVNQGDVVLQLSNDDLDDSIHIPLFLSSREMAQVFPGMAALATPSGYKRSEVGGIRAEVISMAKLPSGLEDVTARVGVPSLARTILQREPAPTLAVLALQRTTGPGNHNSGGYVWSSGGDLPFPPTPGDRLDVEITTRTVRPIALALPALRRFFGWSPPQQPSGSTTSPQSTT